MLYPNGSVVHLGDVVKIGKNVSGRVVCSIDTDEYSVEFPREEWAYLERGVLISSPELGLAHYSDPAEDLELVRRAAQETP
jgi:hypothetical protein